MLNRRSFIRFLLGGGAAALSACSSDAARSPATAKASDTFRLCIDNPIAIDPYNTQESEGRKVQQALFDTLTKYDWQENVLKCAAAKAWDANESETEFTFHLVKDATFHNGEFVTAQSFKRAWERICDPTMSPQSVIGYHLDPIRGAAQMIAGEVKELEGVEVVDDHTLLVKLKMPMADFPYVCAFSSLAPVPQAAFDDPQRYAMAPIGNGPFMMDGEWVPDQRIRLVRYDDYYGTPASLGSIEFSILKNPDAAFGEFEAGHVDFAAIGSGRFGEISMNYGMSQDGFTVKPDARTLTGTECSVYCMLLNCEDEVLSDPDVRRALSLAIDRQRISHQVFGDTYPTANSVVPPVLDDDPAGEWAYCHYDAEAAKALLDKKHPANANGSRDLRVSLSFNSGGGHDEIMKMVAEDLQAVGVEANLTSTEWTAYNDSLERGAYQMARFSWIADYPTIDNFLYPMFFSAVTYNYSRYSNAEVDAALLDARQIADESARKQAYRDVCAQIGRDAPMIPLLFHSHNHVASKRVEHLYYDPQGRIHFEDARMGDSSQETG